MRCKAFGLSGAASSTSRSYSCAYSDQRPAAEPLGTTAQNSARSRWIHRGGKRLLVWQAV